MNTKLLSLLTVFSMMASVSMAQITIDSTDMPGIGDTAIMGIDTIAPALMVGDTGSQTWDFSTIQIDNFDTVRYVDPTTTPYTADFPNADLAIEGATNTYQTLDASALISIGQAGADPFGAGVIVSAPFNPTQTIVTLPSTHGTTFSGTTGFDQIINTQPLGLPVPDIDSIRLVHSSSYTSVFDAYGNLTTSTATYATIRELYTEQTVDSIFAYCSNPVGCNVFIATLPFGWGFVPSAVTQLIVGLDNPAIDTTYTYKWWANGEDVPVAEVVTDVPGVLGVALSAKYKLGNDVFAVAGGTTLTSCNLGCDGTATVNGLGGTGAYNYVWDDSLAQTTATATGLCAGTYNAYIVDGLDTSSTVSFTIGEPSAILMVLTPTNFPNNDSGIVTSIINGGTTPYGFAWNSIPPQTTAGAIDLVPGWYTLTVTDANGCIAIDSAEIIVYPAVDSITSTVETSAICDGTASVTVSGGVPPYTYLWNDSTAQTTATATGLCGDSAYTVTITDNAGSTLSSTVTIDAYVGVATYAGNVTVSVYPNPVTDKLTIETDMVDDATFIVYNIIGEQVINAPITSGRNAVVTDGLANGMYVFQLVNDQGEVVQAGKFTVER